MSDGAGEVIAVGDGIDEFKVADTVVSTFWPYWLGGEMTPATKRDIPGDSVDGYAREYVCMPRTPSRTHRQATRMWRPQRSPARASPPGEALRCAARSTPAIRS